MANFSVGILGFRSANVVICQPPPSLPANADSKKNSARFQSHTGGKVGLNFTHFSLYFIIFALQLFELPLHRFDMVNEGRIGHPPY